jgi:predicted  nucleic acid-binding Zn-ribbon protein
VRQHEALERELNAVIQERTKAEEESVRIQERLRMEQEAKAKLLSNFEKEKENWRATEDARAKAEKDLMQIQMARITGKRALLPISPSYLVLAVYDQQGLFSYI